jgi:hypothetical protein
MSIKPVGQSAGVFRTQGLVDLAVAIRYRVAEQAGDASCLVGLDTGVDVSQPQVQQSSELMSLPHPSSQLSAAIHSKPHDNPLRRAYSVFAEMKGDVRMLRYSTD